MRRFICITSLTSLLIGLLACTDRDKDSVIPDRDTPSQEQAEVTFSYTAATRAASDAAPDVLAFRLQGGSFLYETTVTGEWTTSAPDADGKVVYTRTAQLPIGTYQFLFAAGYGTQTSLSPAAPGESTAFEDVSFQNTLSGDNILPADELYMQYPLADAAEEYEISDPTRVECTMRRVVSRLILLLKRGHKEGGSFVPEPYPSPVEDNITHHLESIDITLDPVAQSISPAGSSGVGTTTASVGTDGGAVDGDGFVSLPTFFFIPTGGQLTKAAFTFHLKEGSGLDNLTQEVDLSHITLTSNQELEIILWFNSFDKPVLIGAEVNTTFSEQDGDQGTWN